AGVSGVIWLALKQQISPGVFSSYLLSMTMLMRPIKNLSKVNEVIQTGLAGAQSIFNTLDLDKEIDTGTAVLQDVRGHIGFSKVSFSYADGKSVLRDVNFEMTAGSTVALVGSSGSGKSTIASLLLRFYEPTSGEITVDGKPLSSISLESLRDQTAIVTQEITLFDQSIRDNIAYGRQNQIDEAKLSSAIEAANLSEFVDKLPEGIDTFVGEQGSRLSGGQRQRIAIARALYRDAPILILDEATSSLDSRSEKRIQSAIDRLIANRTTLVIAHRLSTIEQADQILVLDSGEIIERGTHEELLALNGVYVQLHKSQFNSEDPNPEKR
ncbi:MAG: ATP-binding cassette domain-containing protein, partial [Pseudomonadota bacterium]